MARSCLLCRFSFSVFFLPPAAADSGVGRYNCLSFLVGCRDTAASPFAAALTELSEVLVERGRRWCTAAFARRFRPRVRGPWTVLGLGGGLQVGP